MKAYIKSYSYKSPIINLIWVFGLLTCSYFFIRMVFFPDVGFWIKMICFFLFLFLLVFPLCIIIGFAFIKNIKPKQIVLEENKILIPDLFGAKSSIFRYTDINVLKIVSDYSTIFSPYGGAICIATKKNGYTREVFIKKIWMKNKAEYLELFEFINDRIKS